MSLSQIAKNSCSNYKNGDCCKTDTDMFSVFISQSTIKIGSVKHFPLFNVHRRSFNRFIAFT